MIVAVFRRRLRDGATFEEFVEAWEAESGFGVPARVFNAVSLEDPREILSVGFVSASPADLGALGERVADTEAERHRRIDAVIESTELRAFYALRTEHDVGQDPRAINIASAESLIAALRGGMA